jgi:hypothetical protein
VGLTALGFRVSLVLGVAMFTITCATAFGAGPNIHTVSWKSATVPGSVCGAKAPIHLHGGQAVASSSRWGRVTVTTEPPVYGRLSGAGQDAALGVICSNGGGTAASQLAFARVVYGLSGSKLSMIGVVTPRHPRAKGVHVSLITAKIVLGAVIATEYFYGPDDSDCCPSGRATTYWLYIHGGLTPQVPKVTKQASG